METRMWHRRRRGFTLVELLVATAITLVLAVLLVSITSSMLSSWNRTRGNLMSSNQAKQCLDALKSDVASVAYRNDGSAWLVASVLAESELELHGWTVSALKPDTVDIDEANVNDCRFGRGGVWLRMITSGIADIDDDGDPDTENVQLAMPAAVAYQIVRSRMSASSPFVYYLFRAEVTPQNTFATGYNLSPAVANAYATAAADSAGLPGNIVSPHESQVVAEGVIDFGVRFYATDGALLFPQSASTAYIAERGGDALAATAEIFLRVLTAEGAQLIQNLEAGRIDGDWWDIAVTHSDVFTARVQIKVRGF